MPDGQSLLRGRVGLRAVPASNSGDVARLHDPDSTTCKQYGRRSTAANLEMRAMRGQQRLDELCEPRGARVKWLWM